MILFQIFLLMLLASYLTGMCLTFFVLCFGNTLTEDRLSFGQLLVASLLSWIGLAAFLVAIAEGIDEINGIKK